MPTPIISAAAVDAVRRGLRTAFSLASVPLMPFSRGSGAPRSRLTGFAITGPRMVAAANTTSSAETHLDRALPTALGQSGEEQQDAEGERHEADDHPLARRGRRVHGDLAHRGNRGVCARPDEREQRGGNGDADAHDEAHDDRAREQDERAAREIDPERAEQRGEPHRHEDAEREADDRGDQPHCDSLERARSRAPAFDSRRSREAARARGLAARRGSRTCCR